MKNIIIIIIAFIGISATAQQKKNSVATQEIISSTSANVSPEEMGEKNLADLSAFTTLNQDQKNVLLELFTTKARMKNDIGNNTEQLIILRQSITAKMEAAVSGDIMEKIKANKILFAKLIN